MPSVPIAWPIVQDMTIHGELMEVADDLAGVLAADLDLTGVFEVLPRGQWPLTSFFLWNSEATFDYIGWREAGAYIVLVASLTPAAGGISVSINAYLTEEGDILKIGASEAVIEQAALTTFAHRYINALVHCITGLPSVFGTRIAYARRTAVGAPKEIWWSEFGSKEQFQVSRDGVIAILPAWSPSGALAWTGFKRGRPEIWMTPCPKCPEHEPNGGHYGILFSTDGQNSGIAFSPDGKLAVLTLSVGENLDLFLIDPQNGQKIARLTNSPAIDTSPTWSPDSKKIAFVSDRLGFPQVFVMENDGRDQHPLPLPGSYNTSPDWSPDGAEIAYQSRGEGSRFSIWSYNVDNGTSRRISGGPWDDEEPAWSPDGRMIVFTSTRKGPKLLYIIQRNGTNARPLFLDGGEYFAPAWERPAVPIPVKRKSHP